MHNPSHKTSAATSTTLSQQPQQHPRFSQFEHFLVHTPKSGGSFAFDMLVELVQTSPEYRSLSPQDQFMVCDGRTRRTADFERHYPLTASSSSSSSLWHSHKHKHQVPCTLWMAEQPYTTRARHNYIVLRDPRSHILSQYFHCKESINHYDRWRYMPSLTEWLHAWVSAIGNETLATIYSKQFQCFDPRNMQTRFAGLNETVVTSLIMGSSLLSSLPSLPTTPTIAAAVAQQALESQFVVVGDNHRMWESICAIFIRYTSWIPADCDCSSKEEEEGRAVLEMEDHLPDQNEDEDNQDRQRQLKIHFYGHGVRHHGNTFQTTQEQDELLAQLMTTDHTLYEIGKTVFETQSKALEMEYGIRLCAKRPTHKKKTHSS